MRATPSAIATRQNAQTRYPRSVSTIESANALGELNAGGICRAAISGCSKRRIAASSCGCSIRRDGILQQRQGNGRHGNDAYEHEKVPTVE